MSILVKLCFKHIDNWISKQNSCKNGFPGSRKGKSAKHVKKWVYAMTNLKKG